MAAERKVSMSTFTLPPGYRVEAVIMSYGTFEDGKLVGHEYAIDNILIRTPREEEGIEADSFNELAELMMKDSVLRKKVEAAIKEDYANEVLR